MDEGVLLQVADHLESLLAQATHDTEHGHLALLLVLRLFEDRDRVDERHESTGAARVLTTHDE